LGKVFYAPTDVVLSSENTVQPDLIFISNANVGIIQRRAIFGASDLLVEIISPGSTRRDRHVKHELYARFGVKEYWICDAANEGLEIFTLKDGKYELHCVANIKGKVTSVVLAGLEFELAEIH
jgi:Uma2 family endonuclease